MSTDVPAKRTPGRPTPLVPLTRQERDLSASLPAPLTRFVGREREVAAIVALLRAPSHRLVTLAGPGGVGKTRLALRVVAELGDAFADGVCFVPLDPIASPDFVAAAIAAALGVRETVGEPQPLVERLRASLRERELLLVLDNFEHVLPAAPLVTNLLTNCPRLCALITSRAVLRVTGERQILVPPLDRPDSAHLPSTDRLARYPAIQLFLDRAQAVNPELALTEDTAAAIAAICDRLEGLPLAIELAAARTNLYSPRALLAGLERRLPLLAGGPRDAPARLQTMRDAIAWSYDLLTSEEQALFRRLAVFAGSCTLEGVVGVGYPLGAGAGFAQRGEGTRSSSPPAPPPLPATPAVLDGLTALVDKSMLRAAPAGDGEGDGLRFAMLETIREFGLDQLEASGETEQARRAHAAWCLALAEEAERAKAGPEQTRWLDRLAPELDNLRAALAWTTERAEAETGLRLAAALWWFWHLRGYLSEGRSWLETLLALPDPAVPPAVRAKALNAAGVLASQQGDQARAGAACEAALALARAAGDQPGVALAHFWLGHLALLRGDFAEAVAHCEESERLFRDLGDTWGTSGSSWMLARAAHAQADYERAAAIYEEALATCRATGDRVGAAVALASLAAVAHDRGDHAQAAGAYQEVLALHWEVGERGVALPACLVGLAGAVGALGQPEAAARLFGAGYTLGDAMGTPMDPLGHARFERGLAAVRAALGERAFGARWDAGQTLSLEEAIGEALALAATPAGRPKPRGPAAAGLTPRQLEVLRLLAEGLPDREIADRLSISPRTVAMHVARILTRLGLASRTAAAAYAIRQGLA